MEKLKAKKVDIGLSENLIRLVDVDYFEGPLLTLFEDITTGRLYLYDWVDRNATHNRWMIYQVSPSMLLGFIYKTKSRFDLFDKRMDERVCYSDIDHRYKPFSDYEVIELEEVPEAYVPTKSFFEEEDCPSLEKLRRVVTSKLSLTSQNYYRTRLPRRNSMSNLIDLVNRSYAKFTKRSLTYKAPHFSLKSTYSNNLIKQTSLFTNHRFKKADVNTYQYS